MAVQWADQPFNLVPVPGTPGGPTSSSPELLYIASDMANVHNALLRGLNAIYLQSPFVQEPKDITDFATYIKAWGDSVEHHHSGEERTLFPGIERIAKEAGIIEPIMGTNIEQHHAFEPGLVKTIQYADDVKHGKKKYSSDELRGLIDGFAPILAEHLQDELDTLLALDKLNGKELKKVFDKTVKEGVSEADPHLVLPLMLGCVDRTAPGGANFPAVPFFVPYLNAYMFSRKHQGAWRFNPCDSFRKPRPLQFLGSKKHL